MITPNDYHGFDLEGICEFMVVRFGETYIREYQWKSIHHIECLLYYASHISDSILTNRDDKLSVVSLMKHLQHTTNTGNLYNEDLKRHLVNAIIVIATRNISVVKPEHILPNANARILQILDYIQEHIRQPLRLTIAAIAGFYDPGFPLTFKFSLNVRGEIQSIIAPYVPVCFIFIIS